MPKTGRFDADGNPIQSGGYDQAGYEAGSVASKANTRKDSRTTGSDIPPNSPLAQKSDTLGYWHSLANSLGIPLNSEEFGQMGPTALANMYLPGLGSAVNTISGLGNSHSFQDVNRVLNPLAAPMEQMGSGNVAGGLGSATPFLATALAAPFVPGPKMPPGEAAPGAEGINLLKPRPQKAGPAQVPIYGETLAKPPSMGARALEYGARETASKIPLVGTKISDALKGAIAKPRAGKPTIIGSAPKPRMAVGPPEFAPFEDNPTSLVNKPPTNNPIGTVWAGQPSQPPIPLNDAAFEAHGTPAPYITRSALAGNTQLMPGYQQLPEGQPGASPGIASPVSPFSEQSFAYLRNLMEMNRLKYAQNLTDGANRINK